MKTELYPASCEHLSIRNRIMTVPGQWCRFQVIPASCERGLNMSNLWKLIRRPHKIVILCFAELKEKRQIILLSLFNTNTMATMLYNIYKS